MNEGNLKYWFSVIIPVKDDLRIINLINSINKQAGKDKIEFIISFNGSSEDFIDLVKEKISNNDNYHILISDIIGTANAINFGILKSLSSRFVIIDSDCTIGDNYFQIMNENLNQNMIVNGRIIFLGNNLFSKYTAKLRTIVYNNQNSVFYTPNLGMHREVIKDLGLFNTKLKYGFDSEFSSRVINTGYRVHFQPNAVIFHSCHENLWREILIWIHYGKGRAYRYNSGCFGNKSLKNLIKTLSAPKIISTKNSIILNLFICLYFLVRDLAMLLALLFKKYD